MKPRFSTAWEREDYERGQRGEKTLGPDMARAMEAALRNPGGEISAKMTLAEEMLEALERSTSMMEAMMVQLHSWEHEPTVNVRGQMAANRKLLARNAAESSATQRG